MTNEGDWVFDPFLGTGTTIIAATRHRRGAGSELVERYAEIARERVAQEMAGTLRTRLMGRPVYDPILAGNSLTVAPWDPRVPAQGPCAHGHGPCDPAGAQGFGGR